MRLHRVEKRCLRGATLRLHSFLLPRLRQRPDSRRFDDVLCTEPSLAKVPMRSMSNPLLNDGMNIASICSRAHSATALLLSPCLYICIASYSAYYTKHLAFRPLQVTHYKRRFQRISPDDRREESAKRSRGASTVAAKQAAR